MMFSAKVTEGASSVALAQLLMADRRAPKNRIWAAIGAWAMMKVGRISCGSVPSSRCTSAGSTSVAL